MIALSSPYRLLFPRLVLSLLTNAFSRFLKDARFPSSFFVKFHFSAAGRVYFGGFGWGLFLFGFVCVSLLIFPSPRITFGVKYFRLYSFPASPQGRPGFFFSRGAPLVPSPFFLLRGCPLVPLVGSGRMLSWLIHFSPFFSTLDFFPLLAPLSFQVDFISRSVLSQSDCTFLI